MTSQETLLHDLTHVTIRRCSVSEMDNNVYLITSKKTGAQVLIDAADDIEAIRSLLDDSVGDSDREPRLAMIATTHQHRDHVRALKQLAHETGVRTAAGSADAEGIADLTGIEADVLLEHGDVGSFEGFELTAVHLRGHTPGSIAYVYQDPDGPAHIFSGDALFPGGLGNTQQDPARFTSLYDDVVSRIFDVYPDNTYVHPGHGKGTTLGVERGQLAQWRERGW
jgi:glyoxylase-like metal-dependent hydrolase (beta-lactamase superfamily II)